MGLFGDVFVYVTLTVVGAAGLAQVFVPPGWPAAARIMFRAVMVVALFFALGLYWIVAGESPIETAYRAILCPLQPNAAKCVEVKKAAVVTEVPSPPSTAPRPGASKSNAPSAAAAAPTPGTEFRDEGCPRGCPLLVALPRGDFTMGSNKSDDREKPQHPVRIDYQLAIGKLEVTRGEFAVFIRDANFKIEDGCELFLFENKNDRSWLDTGYPQTDEHPVTCVSWQDASAYVAWLAGKTGKPYRLLSEAEWEYAARAGSKEHIAGAARLAPTAPTVMVVAAGGTTRVPPR